MELTSCHVCTTQLVQYGDVTEVRGPVPSTSDASRKCQETIIIIMDISAQSFSLG